MGSAICDPIARTGLNPRPGAWMTYAAVLPRWRRTVSAGAPTSSWPPSRTLPSIRASPGSRRSVDSARVVFPLPDSPTTPTASPLLTVSVTQRRAWTGFAPAS